MQDKPTIEEQTAFYDRWNVEHRAGAFEEIPDGIRDRGVRVLDILRTLDLHAPRILEVGCGTGWLTEKLGAFGKVTAIDLSPSAIAVARTRNIDAELIAGDFYQHGFAASSFDIVVCVETLFYVEDQPRFVERVASLMKPGAHLILTTVNKFVYERSRDVRPVEPGQVRNWLSRRDLRRLLARRFELLSMTTVAPTGDLGILRLVNSYKINAVLLRLFSAENLRSAKERIGLGGGVVVVARKPV
jgi:2-polyprenyl-3-methyl-5-hydroxy-6-metoxy-1,4-benzoquinol methylase